MTKLPMYFYFFFFFPSPLPTSSDPTNLRGSLKALSPLDQLHLLDLHNNRLNGTISPLANCTNLKLLYLARNDFSVEIPPEIFSIKGLLRIELCDINIRGDIPDGFSRLRFLLTLCLNNNILSEKIPDLSSSLSNMKELNLMNNVLYGRLREHNAEEIRRDKLFRQRRAIWVDPISSLFVLRDSISGWFRSNCPVEPELFV